VFCNPDAHVWAGGEEVEQHRGGRLEARIRPGDGDSRWKGIRGGR
jgi:hypothetical protein